MAGAEVQQQADGAKIENPKLAAIRASVAALRDKMRERIDSGEPQKNAHDAAESASGVHFGSSVARIPGLREALEGELKRRGSMEPTPAEREQAAAFVEAAKKAAGLK